MEACHSNTNLQKRQLERRQQVTPHYHYLQSYRRYLKKTVAQQLTAHLETNILLSNSQYGFRPKLSTESALTTVTHKLYTNMDSKKISLITLCDLSKVFHSVNHEILIQKLPKVKVDSFWLRRYLQDRTQTV